jgi:cytochrome c553
VKLVCRGGLFGGPKHVFSDINGIYYNILSETLKSGYMGTEESIFSIMLYKHSDMIDYVEIESNGLISKFCEDLKNDTYEVKNILGKKSLNKDLNINNVITSDAHYTYLESAELHAMLMAMQLQKTYLDYIQAGEMKYGPWFFIRSPDQMLEAAQKYNCASCHGADYNTPVDPSYPKLAGQSADFLEHSLIAYQRGAAGANGRGNAIMAGMAKPLSKTEIRDIAAYLSSLPGSLVNRK